MGSRWRIRRIRAGPQSEPCGRVRSFPPVAPALWEPSGGFARGRTSTPIRTWSRARDERRLHARLAQLPTPIGPTVTACARRAFRGTRVVARRNARFRFVVVDHTVRPSPAVPSREGTPTGHDQPPTSGSEPTRGRTREAIHTLGALPRGRCCGPMRTHTPLAPRSRG